MIVHVVSVEYAPGIKNISSECYEDREDAVKFIKSRSGNLKKISDNQWFDQSQGITYRVEFLDLITKSKKTSANASHHSYDDKSDLNNQVAEDIKFRITVCHPELSRFFDHCESLGYNIYSRCHNSCYSACGVVTAITNSSVHADAVMILLDLVAKTYCILSKNYPTPESFSAENSLFDADEFDKKLSRLTSHK